MGVRVKDKEKGYSENSKYVLASTFIMGLGQLLYKQYIKGLKVITPYFFLLWESYLVFLSYYLCWCILVILKM